MFLFCAALCERELCFYLPVRPSVCVAARASRLHSRFTKSQASLPELYACFCVCPTKCLVFPVVCCCLFPGAIVSTRNLNTLFLTAESVQENFNLTEKLLIMKTKVTPLLAWVCNVLDSKLPCDSESEKCQ